MTRARNKSGTSKFILILGSLAAIAVIGGVLYQAQSNNDEEYEYQVIPEQVAQASIERPAVPEAFIPAPVPAAMPETRRGYQTCSTLSHQTTQAALSR